jgi:hypothetical protein
MTKRFLVPVLALAALGLPAGASIVEYCSGTGCGSQTSAAFMNDLSTDSYTLQGLTTFAASGISGSIYTDSATGIVFTDFLGMSLSVSSGTLSTPVTNSTPNYIVMTIPATIVAIEFVVNVPNGVCLNVICPTNETNGFVGFLNSTPGAQWTAQIGAFFGGQSVSINNFNAATAGASQSDTPEIGTLLLIGTGLISMRWMKRAPRHRFFRTPQTV